MLFLSNRNIGWIIDNIFWNAIERCKFFIFYLSSYYFISRMAYLFWSYWKSTNSQWLTLNKSGKIKKKMKLQKRWYRCESQVAFQNARFYIPRIQHMNAETIIHLTNWFIWYIIIKSLEISLIGDLLILSSSVDEWHGV